MPTANHPGGEGTKGGSFQGPEMLPAVVGEEFAGSQIRHGTNNGYAKHERDGSDPCEMCRIARVQYNQRRLGIPENTLRNRISAKAQSQALHALRLRYPDEYRELYVARKDDLLAAEGLEVRQRQSPKRVNNKTWS